MVGNFDREAPQTMHPRRAIVPPTRRPAPWGFTVVHVKTLRGTETADAVDPPQTAAVEGHRYRDPRGDGYITYFSAIRYSSARKSSVDPFSRALNQPQTVRGKRAIVGPLQGIDLNGGPHGDPYPAARHVRQIGRRPAIDADY